MSAGPIQTTFLLLGFFLTAAMAVGLSMRPALAYIRWFIIVALCAAVAQDAIARFALPGPRGASWTGAYLASELLQALVWQAISRRYARADDDPQRKTPGWLAVVLASVVLGAVAASSGLLVLGEAARTAAFSTLSLPGFVVRVGSLALFILALTGLEATLVNSAHGQRWRIKFTILGAFTIITAQVFTISLGLLYKTIDLSLTPARQTGFIIGTAFLLYSTLFRGGESPVFVSKRLGRSSVVLFAAGSYLLFLGAFGFIMWLTGSAGNRALLLAVSLTSGAGLMAVLLSERFRRKCNRLLQHYFYKEKYDYRLQWLSFTKRLAQANSRHGLHKAVLLGFCDTFGMGGAVLYLMDAEKKRMTPVETWEIDAAPPYLSDLTVITELVAAGLPTADARTSNMAADPAAQDFFKRVGAAFIVPLTKDSSLDGAILLAKPIDSTEDYNQEDFDLMEAMATHAHSALLNHRLLDQLAKARDMEVMGKVSAFIVHDLKNLVYALSLIVGNARRHIANPEFQNDMLAGLENTVSKMRLLISQLRQLPGRENLELERLDLAELARQALETSPSPRLILQGRRAEALADKEQMRKVALNLILNALEAGRDTPVIVETGQDASPYLRVRDSGCGMTPQFIRDSLFTPFATTKPKGMGIGLYQCQQIVRAHGGEIDVDSMPGRGTVFTVRLPAAPGQSALTPEDP